MKGIKPLIGGLLCLLSAVLMTAPPSFAAASDEPGLVVGRIYHIEGDLLRYVPEEKDWVTTVQDAPFSAGDTLFSGSSGMAELIIPNGVWIRTGDGTQIQFIALDADLAEMDVASGMARVYAKGQAAVKVTSPFGYVQANPGTIFDLYVGDNSIEVVAIKGTVSFVHPATGDRYDVAAGAASILADPQQVSAGDGTVDPDWNRWNMERENFWLAREEVKGPSAEYLPPELRNDAYALEENGSWETVYYEGAERRCWRPTRVAVGWSPFTVGRWTDWYGDQTWIPAEPFGYVTHHYGNWIFVGSRWFWCPPVVGVRAGFPLLDIGFFWCPGRVAWIHSGVYVGWVPLAPRETYYCRRPWGGPHTVIVNNVNINRIHIDIRGHAFADRAVIVNRDHFYGRDDYRNVRVTNINRTTIINNYRMAPVVGNDVIKNYSTTRQRFNFTTAPVREKPHSTVVNRILDNEKVIHEGRIEKASVLQERLKAIPAGRINREARVEQPRGTSHIVPANAVNRPKAELKLPQREIKGGGRGAPSAEPGRTPAPAERMTPARPTPPEPAAPKSGSVAPARPGRPEQPAKPAERMTPARPGQPERETPGAGRVAPARPGQPEQPAKPAERMTPARPAPQPQPVMPAERVTPARPTSPEPAAPGAGRVAPARPGQPEQPAKPAERMTPARPAPQPQPAMPAERVTPARPTSPEPAAPGAGRVAPARPGQPEPPAKPPERMTPTRPATPEPAAPRAVAPVVRPAPQPQPAMPAERAIPARPAPPAPPQPAAPRTEQVAPARPALPEPAAPRTVAPVVRPAPQPQPAMPAERAIPARPAPPAPPQPAAPRTEQVAPAKPVPPEPAKPERAAPQPEPKERSRP